MGVDYKVLNKFFDYDKLSLEFEKVTQNINSDVDIDYAIDVIFSYYRKFGFPQYKITEQEKHIHMKKLVELDETKLLDGDIITQTMHCLRLAWSYFPHWVDVKCGSAKLSPKGYFDDDEKLKGIIKKTWKWTLKANGQNFTENRFRKCLKLYQGSQSVSNFRPTSAKLIYEQYGGDGVVWDMSCGWGGRLLGALASKRIKKYIGTEPSTKTFDGLIKLKKDFDYMNTEIELHKLGSEEFIPQKNTLDLCFTSPPYFDTEKYSDEPTQSYIKFPTKNDWLDGFLKQTIKNCYYGLKRGGYMLINIADTPKYKFIEKNTISISEEIGFEYEKTLQLTLSKMMGTGYKYEPVFVFKKA